MSKEFIKPLTPELRSNINKALDRQRAKLKTCESNAFVSVQLVGLQAWKNLINALPDGYPMPMKKD